MLSKLFSATCCASGLVAAYDVDQSSFLNTQFQLNLAIEAAAKLPINSPHELADQPENVKKSKHGRLFYAFLIKDFSLLVAKITEEHANFHLRPEIRLFDLPGPSNIH